MPFGACRAHIEQSSEYNVHTQRIQILSDFSIEIIEYMYFLYNIPIARRYLPPASGPLVDTRNLDNESVDKCSVASALQIAC